MVHMNTHLAVIDWSRYILKSLRLRPMKGESPTEWKGCGERDLDIILVKAPQWVPKWTHLDRWLLWFRSLDKQWQLKQYFSASGDLSPDDIPGEDISEPFQQYTVSALHWYVSRAVVHHILDAHASESPLHGSRSRQPLEYPLCLMIARCILVWII